MSAADRVDCPACGARVSPEDLVPHGGRLVCDDCAMNALSPAQPCDPWAVKMATGSFATTADAVATLQGLEKALYEQVRERGSVPVGAAPKLLGVQSAEVQRAFSVLRHMELLRGRKNPDGSVDLVAFDTP
ncbi:MAG TPA: hypothetical protein VK997_00155 [Deferrisomatales bacterium]|nr:hypothetical protein [Deferrisomatales bacterium]